MNSVCSLGTGRGLNNPANTGGVTVITLLLGYVREAAAYVQSLGLKAVAVVYLRLINSRSPERTSLVIFFMGEKYEKFYFISLCSFTISLWYNRPSQFINAE